MQLGVFGTSIHTHIFIYPRRIARRGNIVSLVPFLRTSGLQWKASKENTSHYQLRETEKQKKNRQIERNTNRQTERTFFFQHRHVHLSKTFFLWVYTLTTGVLTNSGKQNNCDECLHIVVNIWIKILPTVSRCGGYFVFLIESVCAFDIRLLCQCILTVNLLQRSPAARVWEL